MKKMEKEIKRIPRYSLILVKKDGTNYYYNFELGTFVRMEENEVAPRTTLEKIDFLTCNFSSLEDFIALYGFNEPIKLLKISYQHKGEQMIRPVFGNKEWGILAERYKGPEVDFRTDYNNRGIFEEIYHAIVTLDENEESKFADFLVALKDLSPKTVELIKLMIVHERAIRNRYKDLVEIKDFDKVSFATGVYQEDKDAYMENLKSRLTNYRELRMVYLNYCRYFKKQDKKEEVKKEQPLVKKKVIEPPKQLSIYDF